MYRVRQTEVVYDPQLSKKKGDDRYVVIDSNTGEVLNNSSGHGFKSRETAMTMAGRGDITGRGDKRLAAIMRRKAAKKWLLEHPEVVEALNQKALYTLEHPDYHFCASAVGGLLADLGITISDFSTDDILTVWEYQL